MLLLSAAFGLLVTAHVRLLAHLCFTPPRWRAAAALLVPPLAPFWGWQATLKVWSVVWFVAAVIYGMSLIMSVM